MKELWLELLLALLIFSSCTKSEIESDNLSKNEFKVATITINSELYSFEYFPNGRLKKYQIASVREDVYEYYTDSIVCTMYNLNPRYGIVHEPIYTMIYKLNSKGLANSCTTIHSDNSRSQVAFEYDSNGYLYKAGKEISTVTNGNLISKVTPIWTRSYEYYEDVNNTNSDLFSNDDLAQTGIDFLGKRGRNLLKKCIDNSIPDMPKTYEFSYTYDTKGRVIEMYYYDMLCLITYYN